MKEKENVKSFLQRIDDINLCCIEKVCKDRPCKFANKKVRSVFLLCLDELDKALVKEEKRAEKINVNVSIAYTNARMYVNKIMGEKK